MRCNETCMTEGECSCQPEPMRVVQELREDEHGRLSLRSIITPEWRVAMLSDPEDDPADQTARWPGGIGEEPLFGEPV